MMTATMTDQQLNLNVILPTKGEMRILNALWDLGQGTIDDVH